MEPIGEAILESGRGIAGDRYARRTGTFSKPAAIAPDQEITLIESEQIDAFNRKLGLTLGYGGPRRNIVTREIDLNALVGRRFTVGEATLEGIRLCEPCRHLAKLVMPEVLPGLVHRAGLRARIVSGGTVATDDPIAAIGD